jgi:hypothetical protein
MKIGLGQLRLSPSSFYDMTFEEFLYAAQGMHEQEEARQRQEWERARWSATLALAPHSKKGHSIKPHDLCIFPWEKKARKKGSNKMLKNALNKISDGKT